MKNRRNIVEQQNPPQNPNDIWLKDGKFYRSTSQGWTIIDSELEYTNKEAMTADNPKGGTIGIDKESGEPSIYNNVTKQWSPLGGGVTETTWQELKDKRDAGKLTPGALYRITDYQCTTTQENTKSAGHQFDIVLLALSANKLAEEGWAMMHDNIYDVTFSDGVTKKCYIYVFDDGGDIYLVDVDTLLGFEGNINVFEIDKDNKTAQTSQLGSDVLTDEDLPYNYFQNSNLSAWKVWYCLDNDTARFYWADDSVDEGSPASIDWNNRPDSTLLRFPSGDIVIDGTTYFAWKSEGSENADTWTLSEQPHIGDDAYDEGKEGLTLNGFVMSFTPAHEGTGLPNGRGIIYRMIDEWNNDCPYDFKNIQFVRPMTNGGYDPNGEDTWVYTFTINKNNVLKDATFNYYDEALGFTVVYAFCNYIDCYFDGCYYLPNNVFIQNDVVYSNKLYRSNNNTSLGNFSSVMYNSNNLDNIDSQSIYIGGKKVLTES